MKQIWKTLSEINVNDHTERKGNLTFLSWAWAWAKLMEHYPESNYDFREPVGYDNGTVEVWVTVTVSDGKVEASRAMWLPVMDNRNNSIENPTSRQVSDARMRCLVKCLAMFGLGHYIYAGEDIPESEKVPMVTLDQLSELDQLALGNQERTEYMRKARHSLTKERASEIIAAWNEHNEKEKAA